MMFTRLRDTQALPCSRAEFTAMSFPQAERVLVVASKIEASFLQLRERIAHQIPAIVQPYSSMNAATCSWRVLTFISDRFILSVDTAMVIIWDTATLASSSPAVVTSPWAHFTLSNVLGYVDHYSTLYLAIARVHADHQRYVVLDLCRLTPDRMIQCRHLFCTPPSVGGKRTSSWALALGSRVSITTRITQAHGPALGSCSIVHHANLDPYPALA